LEHSQRKKEKRKKYFRLSLRLHNNKHVLIVGIMLAHENVST